MKKRVKLTDNQVRIFMKDVNEFGYSIGFDELRKIADRVAEGTHKQTDPIAMILCRQIDEAMEAFAARRRP